MDKLGKQALQVTKEIIVKFIEVGRVSPQNFGEIFPTVYNQVLEAIGGEARAVRGAESEPEPGDTPPAEH